MAIIKIRIPDDWVDAIDAAVSERDQVEAEWLRAAIKAALPADVRKRLSVPRGKGQPRKVRGELTPPRAAEVATAPRTPPGSPGRVA